LSKVTGHDRNILN